MKRREFVKKSGTLLAGSTIISSQILSSCSKIPIIGLQLYTIRDKVHENLEGSLEKVASIGYNSVEAAGYDSRKFYGLKPKKFKALVESYGMKFHSSHTGFDLETADIVIEDAAEAGIRHLVIPSLADEKKRSIDAYKKTAEEFNIIGEKCAKAGLTFAYHNHDFEFQKINDQIPYDLLLENTDPGLVKMQLDLFWIIKGGYDPLDYFKKHPGRFISWHVKDMDDTSERNNIETGQGVIDFTKIFEQKELSGLEYFFIELDECNLPEFECIKVSHDYVKSII